MSCGSGSADTGSITRQGTQALCSGVPGRVFGVPIVWTEDPAANHLLETDPLALLIGLVLDQQVKMEKAFGGPYELKQRLGQLDPKKIAAMDPEEPAALCRPRPGPSRVP